MRLEDEIKTSKFQSELQKAHINIIFSANWLRTRISSSLKPFGITHEQFNVLRIIRGQQDRGILAKEITCRMLEPNSNTTRIIDRLEAKGLLQRRQSTHDRRERPVVLTPQGLRLLEQIEQAWLSNSPHTGPLADAEARLLNELLDKLRDD